MSAIGNIRAAQLVKPELLVSPHGLVVVFGGSLIGPTLFYTLSSTSLSPIYSSLPHWPCPLGCYGYHAYHSMRARPERYWYQLATALWPADILRVKWAGIWGAFQRPASIIMSSSTLALARSCTMPILGEFPPYLPSSPANEHALRMCLDNVWPFIWNILSSVSSVPSACLVLRISSRAFMVLGET